MPREKKRITLNRQRGAYLDMERAPARELALRRVAKLARRVATALEGTPYDEGSTLLTALTRALDRAKF